MEKVNTTIREAQPTVKISIARKLIDDHEIVLSVDHTVKRGIIGAKTQAGDRPKWGHLIFVKKLFPQLPSPGSPLPDPLSRLPAGKIELISQNFFYA
jgi:hypothetical protein